MKNILVTGASGFIGFHVSLFLKKKGYSIVGYDNFNDYYDINLKKAREKILQENNIFIFHDDIQNTSLLKKILQEQSISHVIHLAAQAGVRHSFSHPQDYISSNVTGFVSLLEACKSIPLLKIIYASSSSVYGLNQKIPFCPEDMTDHPANLYGATKKTNELIAHSYHHLYNMSLIGLRFFTVYGPFGRPDMAYFTFTKNILEEKPIELFNYGNMKRDFTYIDDIVLGIFHTLEYPGTFDIFNLGNHKPSSLFELVQTIEKKLGKKAITKLLPMPKGEVLETYADISKSQKLLNFHPSTSLEEGISRFVDWYLSYYKISNS